MTSKSKCICQLCTCGRHKCPHNPITSQSNGPCTISEYTREFIPREAKKLDPFKPKFVRAEAGAFDSTTTHKTDFVELPIERTQLHKAEAYVPPEGEFAKDTNYKTEFTPKPYAKQDPIKQAATRAKAGPFQGEPTYKSDYKQYQLEQRKKFGPDFQWSPPTEKFGGISSMKSDFVGYNERPPESCKPKAAAFKSDQPFAGSTDYKDSYIPHPLEARHKQEKLLWQPSGQPLESMTTSKRDFIPKPIEKMASCKPTNAGYASNAPFVDDTTHRNDFRQWPMERHELHKADEYTKSEGMFDGTSTYSTDFLPLPYARQEMLKPAPKAASSGQFQSATDYRENFKKYDGATRVQPIRASGDYVRNPAKFEGVSTFTSHFIPHPIEPTRSFKPSAAPFASGMPIDDATTYKDDYIKYRVEPCPATLLETPRSSYVLKEQDAGGHKFYQSSGAEGQVSA